MVVARSWGRGKWGVVYKNGVSVWEDEKIPEMDGGDGRTTMYVYLMPQNRTTESD